MKGCMRLLCLMCLLGLYTYNIYGQRVDTVMVHSPSMNKEVKNVIVLPAGYGEGTKEYPVLYLLHGYGGNAKTWIGIKPNLPQLASEKGMIIVCPDGKNSWYWDSPVDPALRYETYVSRELISYVDSHYRTRKSPRGRAITGLSMGGHGGMFLGIRHQDTFGACGSISGGVDIRPFPNNWEMSKSLGTYKENPERWAAHTVITRLPQIKPGALAIIIDCGYDDFFYKVNLELHNKMLYYNIPHDFLGRPGGHTGEYWNNAIDYQIIFFDKFFKRK